MTSISIHTAATAAALPRAILSRNIFTASLIAIAGCAALARAVPDATSASAALIHGFTNNKVLWICLAVAVWHLQRKPSPALQAQHLAAGIPALVLAAISGGIWPWIGLSVSLLLLLVFAPGYRGAARTGLLIALIAAIHEITIDSLSDLGGDTLLGIDAQIAGSLAQWVLPNLVVEGTALQHLDGHMLVLVWGCSSLSNLGDTLLLFLALVSLHASGEVSRQSKGWIILCSLALTCLIVGLNALRLALMASNAELYAYLHDGDGAAWYRISILGVTALMSGVAVCR
ncbi:MAG: hypothetical protein ABJ084_10830 [Halioglobus sp.]